VLGLGVGLSVTGFFLAREAHLRQVEAQFHALANDAANSVAQGLARGTEDVLVLRDFFEAGGPIDRDAFRTFALPTLARHAYIQALQWLPEVGPGQRRALEAEARKRHPAFTFFRKPGPERVAIPEADVFHAVYFAEPLEGNEISLGYAADHLATRQETLRRAQAGRDLAISGRIKLIQETAQQNGFLVMAAVRPAVGRPAGMVQGVFRAGDLVQKALSALDPKGLRIRLLDAKAPAAEAVLHEARFGSELSGQGPQSSLRLIKAFDLGGRAWSVEVMPLPGTFALDAGWRAWGVLGGSLLFSLLLAAYVRVLLAGQSQIQAEVMRRTQELAQEMASHMADARALRESEARFHRLVEVMDDGMWVLDPAGATTFANRRMAEMLGYAPEEMVGRALSDFMFEEDVPASQRNLAQRREGVAAQHDFRFRRKDGTELWTIVTGNPVTDEQGRVVSILGMITDITARRQAEQAQLQSQKLESLGVLAGGIAHDFNNLLTAILGNVNLAQLCLPPLSPAKPYLENLEKSVQRATNLTRQMLAYSGKGRFTVAPMDLNHAVQELSHLLAVSISKKVSLRYQLQPDLPTMTAEATQIQQVVMNLVTNASEAIGDAEGIVTIRTGVQSCSEADLLRDFPGQTIEPGSFLTLEVSDTGQGMAPDVQARIFEPFFTTKFTGRGLGLSAMQGIVRGHRGGIRVYSEPGKGTTFKLIFPAGTEGLEPADNLSAPDTWRGSGTILVVDDEEGVRSVAESLLRSMGFEVILAEDGQEALEVFQATPEPFRAVLMDLTMPHLNGVETFRELRRLSPDCRVVLTSGYNEQDAVQEFIGKGLAGFVQKPFQREDLLAALRKALEA
jgi:PAS domain S-box-containing protein